MMNYYFALEDLLMILVSNLEFYVVKFTDRMIITLNFYERRVTLYIFFSKF